MDYENIIYKESDGVAIIIMNRPEVLNAINSQMNVELDEAFQRAGNDPHIKVVVVAGNGERAFSAGADIKEYNSEARNRGRRERRSVGTLDKPVIAAIHGYCLGAALMMAMRADIRVAAAGAKLGLPEIRLGLPISDGGTQLLPRLVGLSKALEMLLTGEPMTAQEAYDFGLVSRVVADDQLMPTVEKLAKTVAAREPRLTALYKKAVYDGIDKPLAEALVIERNLAREARSWGTERSG